MASEPEWLPAVEEQSLPEGEQKAKIVYLYLTTDVISNKFYNLGLTGHALCLFMHEYDNIDSPDSSA